MITAAAFVVAAACGAAARGLLGTTAWRTAALNIIGSFVLGLISQWTGPSLTVIGVGAIGSLTTFSSFVGHWAEELEATTTKPSDPRSALVLVVVSFAGGITAAYLGLELASA